LSAIPPMREISRRKAAPHCAIGTAFSTAKYRLTGSLGLRVRTIRRPKMCPPGQGMPGRVYQIDAGWMGGAASIRYTERPFGLLGRAMLALMFIGIVSLWFGSKNFPKC
jgi:hypothetical protein